MSIAGLQPNPDRDPWDYYPTEAHHTRCLLDEIALPPRTRVWEPAAGNGAMSDVLVEAGFRVTSTDIMPMRADVKARDFLAGGRTPACDWIITNPPFRAWMPFFERCLEIGRPFALLMPIHYLPGLGRRDSLWLPHPPATLVLVPRNMRVVATDIDGAVTYDKTSQFAHVWGVWDDPSPKQTRFVWAARRHPKEIR